MDIFKENMKTYLQVLALDLFTIVDIQWIFRTENQEADAINKMTGNLPKFFSNIYALFGVLILLIDLLTTKMPKFLASTLNSGARH